MNKKWKVLIASVLVIIVVVSAFSIEQSTTDPQMPNLSPGGQLKQAILNRTIGSIPPYNDSSRTLFGYKNVSSTINVSFYSSHASFTVLPALWAPSFSLRQMPSGGIIVVVMKTDQHLHIPVTNFTFEIKDFTMLLNKSLFYEGLTITSSDKYIVTSQVVEFGLPAMFPWPFTFTIGNCSNLNAYYYVNYSFQFVPIVEIGFLHFDLTPILVKDSYVAPWGFKTPQKPS